MSRELTREEKAAIRRLVISLCANYDRGQGCLPLDCECYMLDKCWTGAYCRYFREAVLPTDPVLEAALTGDGPAPDTKTCPVCGAAYLPTTSQAYCSEACRVIGQREADRRRKREQRKNRGDLSQS